VLRNNVYTDGLLSGMKRAIATGKHYSAGGRGAVGYVTRDDCARAAAAALVSADTERRVLDITGPDL